MIRPYPSQISFKESFQQSTVGSLAELLFLQSISLSGFRWFNRLISRNCPLVALISWILGLSKPLLSRVKLILLEDLASFKMFLTISVQSLWITLLVHNVLTSSFPPAIIRIFVLSSNWVKLLLSCSFFTQCSILWSFIPVEECDRHWLCSPVLFKVLFVESFCV